MSVDFFWRRVEAGATDGLDPDRIRALVPHWFDAEFGRLLAAGSILGVERHPALMHSVLMEAEPPVLRHAQLAVYAGTAHVPYDGEFGIWTVDPQEVRQVAAFLQGIAFDELVGRLDADLAEEAAERGIPGSWDSEWAAELVADLAAVREFYAAAAEAGDAVVKVQTT
ncbi:DUF1877 family protein [Kitasatospora sp. NPDC096147]|uniref:DUF1877 family protein n=1 Tax=Kitasatospora sp. NPDC096147 TaxID=3364093 RepID=UPI00380BE84D